MQKQDILSVRFAVLFVFTLALCLCGPGGAEATYTAGFLHEQAQSHYRDGDYRSALAYYEKILSAAPSDGTALGFSAWCCRQLGDLEKAKVLFQRALAYFGGASSRWLYVGWGETCFECGEYEEALKAFETALQCETVSPISDVLLLRNIVLTKKAASADMGDRLETLKSRDPDVADVVRSELTRFEGERVCGWGDLRARQFALFSPDPACLPPFETASSDWKTTHGVPLGADIWAGIEHLRQAGRSLDLTPLSVGRKTYRVFKEPADHDQLPSGLSRDVRRVKVYLTEFDGRILSLLTQIDYAPERDFDNLREFVRNEAVQAIAGSEQPVRIGYDHEFVLEGGFVCSDSCGIWLRLVERYPLALQEKSCTLEIEHVDLRLLNAYMHPEEADKVSR